MPMYRRFNSKFFEVWSPNMTYVLGFAMADGSLDTNPRGSRYFSIQITDHTLLQSIRVAMASEHKIARRRGKGNESDRYRLQIGSKNMCEHLESLGMKEDKTHTMQLPNIPSEYFGSFVRGYFDGDGNVWMGEVHKQRATATMTLQTTFTSCSKRFLEQLQQRLQQTGLGTGSFVFSRNAYRLQYSLNDSIMLYQLMYADVSDGLELRRKRRVFEQYIKMRS